MTAPATTCYDMIILLLHAARCLGELNSQSKNIERRSNKFRPLYGSNQLMGAASRW